MECKRGGGTLVCEPPVPALRERQWITFNKVMAVSDEKPDFSVEAGSETPRWRRGWRALAGVTALGVLMATLIFVVFFYDNDHTGPVAQWSDEETMTIDLRGQEIDVPSEVMYCASCHLLPSPEILPKGTWPGVIERMNLAIEIHDLGEPMTSEQQQQVTDWYVEHAPRYLDALMFEGLPSPIEFGPPQSFGTSGPAGDDGDPPRIGHLRIVDFDGAGEPRVLISDIANDTFFMAERQTDDRWVERKLAEIAAPAQVDVGDVNGNGRQDIVVGSLGTFPATDDPVGSVVLLENQGELEFTARTIASSLARTSDARFVDLNGSGRKDVVFAAFGRDHVGEIGWLEQDEAGMFTHHTIIQGNGFSHVRPTDLTGDGRPDLVVLRSQEHQEVLAFTNEGDGSFQRHLLHKAPHPMWGYAFLELTDLNNNGRLDVVLANGDSYDLELNPKPWHGVQWLENQGDMEFVKHDVFNFFGAYTAVPADLTGNGHLDLVVSSVNNYWTESTRQSLIWLENDGEANFTPRQLTIGPTSQATLAVGDLTDNGRPDILGGGIYGIIDRPERVGRVTIWENHGPR